MRLMFVYFIAEDAGSAQDVHNYIRAAEALGHEVVLYGRPGALPSFRFSLDVGSSDAVFFIFEWTTALRFGDQLDWVRLASEAPRHKRFVIDCDGAYNEMIHLEGDLNHRDQVSSRRWMDVCESLADQILQPTLHPLEPNVRPFFFHAYDPAWERPLAFRGKEYAMIYVGHAKFRYFPMLRVLRAIEPMRDRVGRIAVVGHGWSEMPPWASWMKIEDYFYTDKTYLKKMRVECAPPIPFGEVIDWMSKGVVSPVIYRPLFSHLRFVTCRTFETVAANTIPLFGLDPEYVREIYGEPALELALPKDLALAEEKVADIFGRPDHYVDIVMAIRKRMAERHSFEARLREMVEIARGGNDAER
ncbi:MAG: glycosyltransferase family 1 protein [Chloracidobacterium sp.]|nr:glycosyltransferase family 1 protein [Chloracidobacterium sp.]